MILYFLRDYGILGRKTLLMREKSNIWIQKNKLIVKQDKTEFIIFYLELSWKPKTVTFLGIHLDAKLNKSALTSDLCKRLGRINMSLIILLLRVLLSYCTSLSLAVNDTFCIV